MIDGNKSFHDTLAQIYKQELYNLTAAKQKADTERVLEIAETAVKHFRKAQELVEGLFSKSRRKREQKEKERDGNDENLRDFQMSNMNTSYFGEIEVNLCVASFLEDLNLQFC